MQDLSIQHKTRDRAERQFTQVLLSDGGQKKTCLQKPCGEKSREEIWVGTMAQFLNSPSYEATKFKHTYLRWLKECYTYEINFQNKTKKMLKVQQGVSLE